MATLRRFYEPFGRGGQRRGRHLRTWWFFGLRKWVVLGLVTDRENVGPGRGVMQVVCRFGHSLSEFEVAVGQPRRDTLQVVGCRA